tara:strand:+ start:4921 stop:5208 length:288 start_codon:yes stop_codon:yes gene_type:complete
VSWKSISIPVLATAIPDIPPETKKKINKSIKNNGNSIAKELLAIVTHQCISLVAAGTEIITVRVLNSILVVWDRPTIYIWCPQTKKPRNAIVYIE